MDSSIASSSAQGARLDQAMASVADLALRIASPEFDSIRELYDIQQASCSRLCMSSAGWAVASDVMGLPRGAVENQIVLIVRDRFTGHEAIINPVRARRTAGARDTAAAPAPSSSGSAPAHCRWCREWGLRQSGLCELAGLTVTEGECVGWVSLAPIKERDFTALSVNVTDGARFMYRIWRDLAREGTRNFSLAAILSPGHVAGRDGPGRFARWPNVVWRFVDRGDPEVTHGDIGTMELFGSAVIASDPFVVAGLLRR
jgi:hypothetical protein